MIISSQVELTTVERSRLEAVEGIAFDIQRYSLHDGPGIRTNIFLKGCPLRCQWCANPESQSLQPQIALTTQNCISCGQFSTPCPLCWEGRTNGDAAGAIEIDFSERIGICPTGAIHSIGKWQTAGAVMSVVRRDAPFYGEDGGMTLTGGEATMQPDMADALLQLAKAEGISTAIETCGHTQFGVFERLLPSLDLILYDLKHVDRNLHKAHTGLDNDLILANLQALVDLRAPLIIRIPLIPGFNADPSSMEAIARHIVGLGDPSLPVHLLPYHTLGSSKYVSLDRYYPWEHHQRLSENEIESLVNVIASHQIPIRIGG